MRTDGVGRLQARRPARRRRSRGRRGGAASCSAGRRCPWRRRRWRAPPGRGRPRGRRWRRCCRRARAARGRSARPGAARPCGPWPSSRSPRRAGRAGWSTSASPTSRAAESTWLRARPARRRTARAARSNAACTASAVSGVFSDGFQTTGSPQTSASAAFHDQTATGKLKAVITPTTPSGCQVSIIRCSGPLGGDGEAVELAREADREVADVDHLLDLAEALRQRLAGLERDQQAEVGLRGAQLLAEQADELAAPRRRDRAPGQEGRVRRRRWRRLRPPTSPPRPGRCSSPLIGERATSGAGRWAHA